MKPFYSHFQRSRLLRPAAVVMSVLMAHAAVPATTFIPKHDPRAPKKLKVEEKKAPVSRKLKASEMKDYKGRALGNPYYSGNAKYDMVYKGVNVRTGDYSYSANDLSFEGGYGIPVSVARSYSANCIDEGPFGVGWSFSTDMRTTVGGLIKSSSAPVRSVPVNIRMRPSEEVDPNLSTQPVEAILITDSTGTETTVQRDVDGVLTTPPWEKNTYDAEYEVVWDGSTKYEILLRNKTTTPDGTVYEYEKKGVYTGGTVPWNNSEVMADPEPCNVLKVVSATDRNGNETTFDYGSTDVSFQKSNGWVDEKPLVGVDMPNGRFIDFTWTGNRITKAEDNEREVVYTYSSGRLASVTSPGGRITRYTWGAPTDTSLSAKTGTYLLTAITDPRGLTTEIDYIAFDIDDLYYPGKVMAWQITEPNGFITHIRSQGRADANYDLDCLPPGTNSFGTVASDTTVIDYGRIGFGSGSGLISTNLDRDSGDTFNMKYYDSDTLNLVEELTKLPLALEGMGPEYVRTRHLMAFNFMGNPLSDISQELDTSNDKIKEYRTDYSYWGEDKYFQQKASRTTLGSDKYRYSYTDYFDSTAVNGKRGQVHRIYDDKYAGYHLDTNNPTPAHAVSGGYAWKYQLEPMDAADFVVEFDYDSKSRVVKTTTLKQVVSGIRHCVDTVSAYGGDGSPSYGNSTSSTDDYGSGKINRIREILSFDVSGKETHVRDALGREYQSTYDGDGNLLSIIRVDCSPSKSLITKTYGSTDGTVENGQPTSIADDLSGASQSISYVQTGSNAGEPLAIAEFYNSVGYDIGFEYNLTGQRERVTVATPNGVTRWKYSSWITAGMPGQNSLYFQKLNKQEYTLGNWHNSSEEYEYLYDAWGRLQSATFAQTPQSGQANYDSFPPASRARAEYTYDNGGRVKTLEYFWDRLGGSEYETEFAWACDSTYNHPLSLSDSSGFFHPNVAGTSWIETRRETYEYEVSTDYLSEVDYNFGSIQTNSWAYDAAGNRVSDSLNNGSWSYDNLNRIEESPSGSFSHDLVGNRISSPSHTYQWDDSNRLSNADSTSYVYRSDGMRIAKIDATNTQRYYYLGNLLSESEGNDGSSITVTRNALGARSIDGFLTTTSVSSQWAYPIYDIRGNQKAVLSRDGSGDFVISSLVSYDAWGNVLDGTLQNDSGHQAKLGHMTDSETDLHYMRARFYDPSMGRFISEDSSLDGSNWYIYCRNDPLNKYDSTGKSPSEQSLAIAAMLYGFLGGLLADLAVNQEFSWKTIASTTAGEIIAALGNKYIQKKLAMLLDEFKRFIKPIAERIKPGASVVRWSIAVVAMCMYFAVLGYAIYLMVSDMADDASYPPHVISN